MLALTVEFILQAMKDGRHDAVIVILDAATNFFEQDFIQNWIQLSGGWVGLTPTRFFYC